MTFFHTFIQNKILIIVLITMVETQLLKSIINAIINRRFNLHILISDGGMPSSHAAVVSSLCTACAFYLGAASEGFTISFVLAMIVCRDAIGVRRETGKQAAVINDLQEIIEALISKDLPDTKLRELVGHTPLQVAMGLLNGIGTALVLCFVLG